MNGTKINLCVFNIFVCFIKKAVLYELPRYNNHLLYINVSKQEAPTQQFIKLMDTYIGGG